MSFVTANGVDVSEARGTFPLTGAWHYDLFLPTTETLSGAVSIDIGGALTLSGTALMGGTYTDALYVRVLAGAGGWLTPCQPRYFQGAALGTILANILQQGGETLSSTADATAKAVVPQVFAMTSASVGSNVRALMQYAPAGTSWRFLPSGEFWIGPETWPAFGKDYQVMSESPIERRMDLGFEFPTLQAGQSVVSQDATVRHVNRVESIISGDGFSARAWWQA